MVAVYNQPRNNFVADDLHRLSRLGNKVLIMGDLNARHQTWNNHINHTNGIIMNNHTNGRTLYNFSLNNNLIIQHTKQPTHFPGNGMTPTYIDLILNKNVTKITDPLLIPELFSDHKVQKSIKSNKVKIYDQHKNSNRKIITSCKDTDWTLLQQELNEKIQINNKIDSTDKIDTEVEKLTTTIQKIKNKFTNKIQINTNKLELTEEIRELIKHKNNMRKLYQQQYYNQNLKTYINQISRIVRTKVKQVLNDKWGKTLEDIKPNDRALWRISKALRKTQQQIPTLTKNDKTYMTDKEKVDVIGEALQNMQRNEARSIIEEEVLRTVNEHLQRPIDCSKVKLTKPNEIVEIIKKLPNQKAPGIDEIDNKMIKNLPKKAIVQLMYIINHQCNTSSWTLPTAMEDGNRSTDP